MEALREADLLFRRTPLFFSAMLRPLIVTVVVVAMLVACGGGSTGSELGADAGPDGSMSSGGDASLDGASPTPLPDAAAGDAGGACAKAGTASKCILCCRDAFPGAGAELVFSQECQQCSGLCGGKAPCSSNASLAADGGCVKCLSPKLGPAASGWAECQQGASCAGFVACFAACPTT
jgi:hypothetical protein